MPTTGHLLKTCLLVALTAGCLPAPAHAAPWPSSGERVTVTLPDYGAEARPALKRSAPPGVARRGRAHSGGEQESGSCEEDARHRR